MSICKTNIEYNGVRLNNVLTESISYDPVYDETGTDLIGMHTRVVVTAYAHAGPVSADGVNAAWVTEESNWAPALTAMFRKLSMPRRRFRMLINNFVMFDIRPTAVEGRIVVQEGESGEILVIMPGQEPIVVPIELDSSEESIACNPTQTGHGVNQDIAHGPKCSYQVMGIQGASTARCRFTFEFTTPLCESPALIRDFLHLRYWIVDDIDCTAWLTTRTYQGTFRVKGMQVDAHALARQITLPPIQPGFRRTRINWSESPDHLTMSFTIVDVEQKSMAPSPATHWEGSYSVSMPQGDITAESEIRFRLWGDVTLDKTVLFKLGQHILNVKLNYLEMLQFGGSFIVLSQIWDEKLDANEISIYVKIKHMGTKDPNTGQMVHRFLHNVQPIGDKFNLGKDLDPSVTDWEPNPDRSPYDPLRTTTPENGLPTAGLGGIFICALQTPCCPQTLSQNSQTEKDIPYEKPPPLPTDYEPPQIIQTEYDAQPERYSSSHRDSAYLWYRMTNHYHKDTGWRAFPRGKQCVATTDNTVAFSRIHCPVAVREIRVEACRMNKSPELPDFRDSWTDDETGIHYVLKDVVFEPSPPQLSADARHEIREMYARYFYYMSRPPTANEDWLAGRLPYIEAGTKPLLEEPDGKPGTLVPTEAFKDPSTIFGREAPGLNV